MLYPKDPTIEVTRTENALTIQWRSRSATGAIFLCFGVFVLVLTACAILLPDSSGRTYAPGFNVTVGVMGTLFGLLYVYLGLCPMLNTWTIVADRSAVSRRVRPMWFTKDVEFAADGIKQFFYVPPGRSTSSTTILHAIHVIDRNDHARELTRGLPSSFAANQVCHELEDFYGIEYMPVYGVTTDPSHPGPRGSRN